MVMLKVGISGAEELYGYSEDETTGKPIYELLHSEFPETSPRKVHRKLKKDGEWKAK